MTLHRHIKAEQEDEMLIDVLVTGSAELERMIDEADIVESETMGLVRVVKKGDLIRLKLARNSKLDQADIEELEHDQGRQDIP